MPSGLKHIVAKQGIFDSKTGIQIGVELLSRWIDSNGQALAPCQLKNINWAEIDLQVIKQIGEFIKQENTCDTLFFINISKELLSHYQLFDIWLMITQELAQRYGPCFVIEITEEVSPKLLEKNYSKLKATGAKLAIDDFGDGYTELSTGSVDSALFSTLDSNFDEYFLRIPVNLSKALKSCESIRTKTAIDYLKLVHRDIKEIIRTTEILFGMSISN